MFFFSYKVCQQQLYRLAKTCLPFTIINLCIILQKMESVHCPLDKSSKRINPVGQGNCNWTICGLCSERIKFGSNKSTRINIDCHSFFAFAGDGVDYIELNSLRIIITPINQLLLQCTDITVVDDLICEADETIPILLNSTDGIMFTPSSAVVTIVDDEGTFFVYMVYVCDYDVHL